MKEILKAIGLSLRELGFRGSGQNYRKSTNDFVFVINIQGSRWGDNFYINLGAQPTFIPAEGFADLAKIKEYECILRKRVGNDWPWDMSNDRFTSLLSVLRSEQQAFFDHVQTIKTAISTESPDTLISMFSSGTTHARAAMNLARAAAKLGHKEIALKLAEKGLSLAGAGATILCDELQSVINFLEGKAEDFIH